MTHKKWRSSCPPAQVYVLAGRWREDGSEVEEVRKREGGVEVREEEEEEVREGGERGGGCQRRKEVEEVREGGVGEEGR